MSTVKKQVLFEIRKICEVGKTRKVEIAALAKSAHVTLNECKNALDELENDRIIDTTDFANSEVSNITLKK